MASIVGLNGLFLSSCLLCSVMVCRRTSVNKQCAGPGADGLQQ
uniref:Uncharacterized protein n=1 Tax=Anguilla anguilla TaxID=7936 RepID=A0A0E9QXA5_ANGAN